MPEENIELLIDINEKETKQLLCLWEKSVNATHEFLSKEDIQSLKPFVRKGISQVERLLCIRDEIGNIQAFMGTAHNKVEMLFVSPAVRRKGLGKKLMEHAVNELKAVFVDVNEQNPQAIGFYKHLGFHVFDRSEFDEQGNPFPILHMKLTDSCSYT